MEVASIKALTAALVNTLLSETRMTDLATQGPFCIKAIQRACGGENLEYLLRWGETIQKVLHTAEQTSLFSLGNYPSGCLRTYPIDDRKRDSNSSPFHTVFTTT